MKIGTHELTFIWTWDEWYELTDGKHDIPVICPRCSPKVLADCDCLTPSLVEDEGLQTVETNGREWAVPKGVDSKYVKRIERLYHAQDDGEPSPMFRFYDSFDDLVLAMKEAGSTQEQIYQIVMDSLSDKLNGNFG